MGIRDGIQQRLDSFLSQVTGHGVAGRDRVESFTAKVPVFLTDEELARLYDSNDLISNMCHREPLEMLREGFKIVFDDGEEDLDKIELAQTVVGTFDDFGLMTALHEAFVWEAVFGGSLMVLLADDGANIETPLRLERIREFRGVQVYDRRYVEPVKLYEDPLSPDFGKPSLFKIRSESESKGSALVYRNEALIHASRCIVFPGMFRASLETPKARDGWGMSKIEKTHDAFRAHSIAWSGMTSLVTTIGQGVWAMKGYLEALADGKSDLITKRIAIADYAMSTIKSIIIDADSESFDRKPHSLGGISEVLREYNQRVCAAADQPATVLFGMSPAGLNATGESDRKIFNDKIKAAQARILTPKIDRLIDIITHAPNGPTEGKPLEDWSVEYHSLEQLSEFESADLRLKQAQADGLNIDKGVALPEEIALSRFRATGYSTDTTINREMREQALEDELDRDKDEEANTMQLEAMKAAMPPPPMPPTVPGVPPDDDTEPPKDDEAEA